MKLLHFIDKFN